MLKLYVFEYGHNSPFVLAQWNVENANNLLCQGPLHEVLALEDRAKKTKGK